MKRTSKKSRIFYAAMLILTAVYPVFMVMMSGAGLIYNRSTYGERLCTAGVLLIVSGAAMTTGSILALPEKRITAAVSLLLIAGGLVLCLCMLHILTSHADSAGWSDNYTMEPVSAMYRRRMLPSVIPAAMAGGLAVHRLLSAPGK